jgi:hypothetical protein
MPETLYRIAAPYLFGALLLAASAASAPAQKKDASARPPAAPLLKRTMTRHETRRLGYGSTLTILGAPDGAIRIESWPRSEADITAEIELSANTEEDLDRLAAVNSFLIDADANHVRLITVGMHDKKYMQRTHKDFPKNLLTMPWRISYRVRVPQLADIEISAGRGPIEVSGVEGAMRITALESRMSLVLTGGAVMATVGSGSVDVHIQPRSWRGRGADIQLARGDLTVDLPPGFNADINAAVLRAGRIENTYTAITPLEGSTPTERSLQGRAGSGGATLSFTVGDGTLRIKQATVQ